jgi:hypothetical protein
VSEFRPERRTDHPSEAELTWFVDRVLRAGDRDLADVHTHLASCHQCALTVDRITAQWDEGDE